MRYIDFRWVEAIVTAEWLEKAKSVRSLVEEAWPDKDKVKEIISANSSLWRELKKNLASVMAGKCWYCETRQDRSDDAVDHFRPKGKIFEEKGHPGYWWLAFDHTNFRYSCTYCNSHRVDVASDESGGKQDHFPLMLSGVRAQGPQDSLDAEKHVLLDPCRSGDPNLVVFDESGIPSPSPVAEKSSNLADRVVQSARFYHWRQTALVTQRRLMFKEVERKCAAADAVWEKYRSSEDDSQLSGWVDMVQEIGTMLSRRTEHSAAAKSALLGLRTTSVSAENALLVM